VEIVKGWLFVVVFRVEEEFGPECTWFLVDILEFPDSELNPVVEVKVAAEAGEAWSAGGRGEKGLECTYPLKEQ